MTTTIVWTHPSTRGRRHLVRPNSTDDEGRQRTYCGLTVPADRARTEPFWTVDCMSCRRIAIKGA